MLPVACFKAYDICGKLGEELKVDVACCMAAPLASCAARRVVAGGDVIEKKFKRQAIPVEFLKICNEPDGTFSSGIMNPFLPENVMARRRRIVAHSAGMGITWDGDFDRRFLFDENGDFSWVATSLACRLKHF